MFSSVLEKEKEYPDYVQYSQQNFSQIVEIVKICQAEKILRTDSPELTTVSVWSAVHGLIMLILEGQISHNVLDRYSLKEILVFTLNQITLAEVTT
jgi:hypothetical protein